MLFENAGLYVGSSSVACLFLKQNLAGDLKPVHQAAQLPRMTPLTCGVQGGSLFEFKKFRSKPHLRVGAP